MNIIITGCLKRDKMNRNIAKNHKECNKITSKNHMKED